MTWRSSDPLLIGLSAGDESAFAQLYAMFGTRLLRTAQGILRVREDAEDAVQDVFVTVVRSRRQLLAVEDLTAYLFAALRHATARCAARRERTAAYKAAAIVTSGENGAAPGGRSTDPLADGEIRERLHVAMQQLPPEQREVVSLRLAGELTFAQIACATEVSVQTAASRYRYGLEKLRALLKDDG